LAIPQATFFCWLAEDQNIEAVKWLPQAEQTNDCNGISFRPMGSFLEFGWGKWLINKLP